jgi:ATP-grasp ribosomal peptide maturase
MTVLVLTSAEDVTADMVIERLTAMNVSVLRVDPVGFPQQVTLTAAYTSGALIGSITTGHRTVDLREIRSIWVRRPGVPGSGAQVQPGWVAAESDHAWYGTLRALPGIRWMNHPDAATACRYKMRQLVLAQAAGFRVPATVFTTAPADARRFADDHGPLVCKSVSGRSPDDPPLALPTTPVPGDADFASVAEAPTCLQSRIDKHADVRLTVVGSDTFCARTDHEFTDGGECRELDWRYTDPQSVRWRAVRVPSHIKSKIDTFMKTAGLAYGAFDFAVTGEDIWYFLECNASGQFGFIELGTGLPISQSIANWLAAG